jgi:CBS domain-containing protein
MAIKSYQGELVGKAAPKAEEIRVEHYMNKAVVSFKISQDILEIMNALVKNGISGGPIVSESNEVVGFISEGDCIKQMTESKYYNLPLEEMSIEHYMTKNVICVGPDESLLDIANKFLITKKRNFPVVHDGKLIGLISQKNVLKAVLDWKGTHYPRH